MSRINTNIQALLATRVLNKNNASLNQALQRLSTGLRINTGKDDPAGLIASEALRTSQVAISAAIDNADRANNIVAIAEGGLQEINSLLLELENLVDRGANEAGLSAEEVAANQLQIDAILQSINRIADTTEFAGRKLLNGTYDFTVSGTASSNLYVSAIEIHSAKIPEGATRSVTVEVQAGSTFGLVSAAGTGPSGATDGTVSLQVRGNYGTEILSFASGTTVAQIATAVNGSTQLTGVSAVVNGSNIQLASQDYGSEAFVSVEVLQGTFNTSTTEDYGSNGQMTINGAQGTVSGREVSVRTGGLSLDLVLGADFARMSAAGTSATFELTGGGAVFAISPTVGLAGQESIGLKALTTGSLGNGMTGYLSSLGRGQTNDLDSNNFATAQRVVRTAINQVTSLRGRIGAFQKNTLQTTINSLQVAAENTAAAESAIRDADFAVETAALTRAQILVQASTATLQMATAQPQNVLALLG